MPEKKGMVSLWLGVCEDEHLLDNYIKVKYTKNGDRILSQFSKDTGIDRYAPETTEVSVHSRLTNSIKEILSGHSYDAEIIQNFVSLNGAELVDKANCVILAYNIEHKNRQLARTPIGDFGLIYIGCVKYD